VGTRTSPSSEDVSIVEGLVLVSQGSDGTRSSGIRIKYEGT